MRKKLLTGSALILVASLASAQTKLIEKVTKKGDELVIPYEKYQLSNGLTLVIHEDHSDPVAHVDVTYHVGSAREEIGKSGFAHFFEHMMFQGSDNVGDEQHFKIVSEAGGTLNGSTNRDRTNYYETVPSNQVEKMLWLEADRMGFLLDAVTQQKFEIQRSTVKNERGQNYDNRPYGLLSEVSAKNLYPYGHPYSWLTIGYIEELNAVNVNDLKNFFLRWYGPNNATLTIGGDVQPAQIVKWAEKYFGSIPRGPEVVPVKLEPVQLTKDRYASYVDNYARSAQLRLVYPTVRDYDKDEAALSCLAQVLGGGGGGGGRGGGGGGGNRNSVLYQTLIKPQKALSASASNQASELAGEFAFSVTPYPGKNLAEMEALIKEALTEFEKRGITDEDVERFKTQFEARTINGLASVSGKVSQLAAYQTFAGNPNMIKTQMEQYSKLSKEDVMRAYEKYIKNKPHVILSVLVKGQEDLIAHANDYTIDTTHYQRPDYGYAGLKYNKAKDNFDRKKMPGNGPNPAVKVPAFWRKDLPSGIKMIGTENTEIPTVTISISMPGGHLMQANELSKVGLANLFGRMMNEDTKTRSAEEFSAELQKIASSINVSSGKDEITLNIQTLKKNLDKTLALAEERLFRPQFNQEDLDRIKRQLLESFKQSKTQPATVASDVIAKLNFGPNNILAISESGTAETVENISLNDIQFYYDNYMTSKGLKVVIVGDIKEAEILPKLGFLNKLPNKNVTVPKVAATPMPNSESQIYLIDIPKAAQTEFRVGYNTGLKYDATGEYYRTGLLNYALGGDFNSRLNLNLREDKGWTYGARSSFSGDEYDGDFKFSSGIKAEATDSALGEVIKEIRNYAADGITEDELAFMKNAIGQRDARAYETSIQKAGFIRMILDYNLPANYTATQAKILQNMTKKELDGLIKKHISANKLNMLLVGDKAKILPGLQKMGYKIIELDAEGKPVGKRAF
ncbi:insulinase family protein [Terrimonas sp. NA20]|uniref:Insulinase family protein n=1 Tax=Terrimonas ginsenosidimutans TaxID=2908004 RepID=A0ABS9KNG8_9BACT|nr:pitrilysin family protein [Terrimonas ginsenosidimutans]MCG2613880.1 insulinase family protein [Terrimonas ginsenosidimutans]